MIVFITSTLITPTSSGTRIIIGSGPTPIAAEAGNFSYDGTINDELPRVPVAFDGKAGEVIGIEMQVASGDLDPYLLLTNANGDILIENDDDPLGFGRDAYIREFTLPKDDQYIIIATRLDQNDGSTEGDFVLTLERRVSAASTPEITAESDGPQPITCGQSLSETIDDTTFTWRFSFEAVKDQTIGIQMVATSGDLDSIVRLFNDSGDMLQENDDDPLGVGKDAYLRDIVIPTDGNYIIEATRFKEADGPTSGDFDVTLICP